MPHVKFLLKLLQLHFLRYMDQFMKLFTGIQFVEFIVVAVWAEAERNNLKQLINRSKFMPIQW